MSRERARRKLMDQIAEWISQRRTEGAEDEHIKLALIAAALMLCCERTGTKWKNVLRGADWHK
jgi:hypothetical protein